MMIKTRPHTGEVYLDIQEEMGESDAHPYGAFLSIELIADGQSLEELLDSAYIYEIDQDGGEYRSYPLDDAPNYVIENATKLFIQELEELKEHT